MNFTRETRTTTEKRYVMMEYTNSKGDIKEFDNRKRAGVRGAVPKSHPEDSSYKLTKVITYMPDDVKAAYKDVLDPSASKTVDREAKLRAIADAKAIVRQIKADAKVKEKELKVAEKLSIKLSKKNSKSISTEALDMDLLTMAKYTHVTDVEILATLPIGASLSMPHSAFQGVSAFKFRVDALFAGIGEDGKPYCITNVNDKMVKLPNRHGFYIPNDGKYRIKALGKVVL